MGTSRASISVFKLLYFYTFVRNDMNFQSPSFYLLIYAGCIFHVRSCIFLHFIFDPGVLTPVAMTNLKFVLIRLRARCTVC